MTTPRRANVSRLSLAALSLLSLTLGACAAGPSSAAARDAAAVAPQRELAFRFDNEAATAVRVYLVGEQREWMLGRVEPGARATLRIPEAALTTSPAFVRLAVLSGGSMAVQAARDPRANFTIAQPAAMLLSQRFSFSQRQLAAPQILSARADARGPLGRP